MGITTPGERGHYNKEVGGKGLISASIVGLNFDSDRKPWPLGLVLFGLLMLLLAAIGTFTGKTYGRYSADRAEEPVTYWLTLAMQYLLGAFLICLGLAISN